VDSIKIDLGDINWGRADCLGRAQNRGWWRSLVNAVINIGVP
jgi:hypothetical protein